MFIVLGYIIIIFLTIITLCVRNKKLWRFSNQVEGLNVLQSIGVFFNFKNVKPEDIMMEVLKLGIPFKRNFKAWFGPIPILWVKDPEDVKTLLNCNEAFEKPSLYKQLFSYGFLTIGGSAYRRQRKVVSSLFHTNSLEENLPTINKKMKSFLSRFDGNLKNEMFDVSHNVLDFTLDTLLATTFGMDSSSEETRKKFVHDMDSVFVLNVEKYYKFWLLFDPIHKLSNNYKQWKKHKDGIFEVVDKLVEKNEQRFQKEIKLNVEKSDSVVDKLYQFRDTMTYNDMQEGIFFFIMAGFDTTGKNIPSALLLLAMHPEIQDKVVDELRGIFTAESDDEDVSDAMIKKMIYLEMVIKETLRLLPPVIFYARELTADVELKSCTAPKGTMAVFFPIEIQTNKELWGEDADKFNPERFSEENISKVHPYAFAPFVKGRRMCLGYRYAWIIMKIFLSKFLLKYRVSTDLRLDELIIQTRLTICLKQGFIIKAERRK